MAEPFWDADGWGVGASTSGASPNEDAQLGIYNTSIYTFWRLYVAMAPSVLTVDDMTTLANATVRAAAAKAQEHAADLRDALCTGWYDMPHREYLRTLCERVGYERPPPPLQPTPELLELLIGNLIIATLVIGYALTKVCNTSRVISNKLRRRRAMNRSLSCPAIVDLQNERALDACAGMLAAFDTALEEHEMHATPSPVRASSPRRRVPRVQSLTTLSEAEEPPPSPVASQRRRVPDITDTPATSLTLRSSFSVSLAPAAASPLSDDSKPPPPEVTASPLSTRLMKPTAAPAAASSPSHTCILSGAPPPRPAVALSLPTSLSAQPAGHEDTPTGEQSDGRQGSVVSPDCDGELCGAHSPQSPPAPRPPSPGIALLERVRGYRPRLRPISPRRHLTHVCVLGGESVGKSEIIRGLEGFAAEVGMQLSISEGVSASTDALLHAPHSSPHSFVPLVVWSTSQSGKLTEYVSHHLDELMNELSSRVCGRDALALSPAGQAARQAEARDLKARMMQTAESRMLVFCNKSDVQPCPLPEAATLNTSNGIIFLAGSARRGTNMRALWRLVETCTSPARVKSDPKADSKADSKSGAGSKGRSLRSYVPWAA